MLCYGFALHVRCRSSHLLGSFSLYAQEEPHLICKSWSCQKTALSRCTMSRKPSLASRERGPRKLHPFAFCSNSDLTLLSHMPPHQDGRKLTSQAVWQTLVNQQRFPAGNQRRHGATSSRSQRADEPDVRMSVCVDIRLSRPLHSRAGCLRLCAAVIAAADREAAEVFAAGVLCLWALLLR